MVGIVVVSHSARIAEGVVELAREMGGSEVAVIPAGGTDDPEAPLGTDAVKVMAAVDEADSGDGVLVLMDLGSAMLSAEMALEMLSDEARSRVLLCSAPLVEGAVSAATAARLGLTLAEVAIEAREALGPKVSHLSSGQGGQATAVAAPGVADAQIELLVRNRLGLHARPAARFVQTASRFDATVDVTNLTTGTGPAGARSLNAIAILGVRRGHTIRISARGPEASDAIEALTNLAADNFGDDDAAADAAPPPQRAAAPAAIGSLTGIPASPGIALGPVRHLTAPPPVVPNHLATDPAAEWQALEAALARARREIAEARDSARTRFGEEQAGIFEAHLLFLDDEALLEPARRAVNERRANAARAWNDAVESIAHRYEGLDDPYQAERAADVRAVGGQVLALLRGETAAPVMDEAGILVARELTPADAARLDPQMALGIVTAAGGPTSHSAIFARALGVPAIVGAGEGVLELPVGTTVAIDGGAGEILVNPPTDFVRGFRARLEAERAAAAAALEAAAAPAFTADGRRIEVFANIGQPSEVEAAVAMGAEGVGLLRTEFLFLDRATAPSEEEQYATYSEMAERLGPRPLIIRTLDTGADKPLPYAPLAPETNPFLGARGLRVSLAQEELFAVQLRAVLRAAAGRSILLMFPMVTTLEEYRAARRLLDRARAELIAAGTDAAPDLEVGIMVEVPAAALSAGAFAPEVDFFSIGTNDLAQYTMAADRGNDRVAPLADPLHPSILRLIATVTDAAKAHGKMVGVCGEVAGDPVAADLLVGLGVTELSMAAAAIPAVKRRVRSLDAAEAESLAQKAVGLDSAKAVRALVAQASGEMDLPSR